MIYNEFLLINICGLSRYTKYYLDLEAKNEISMIGEILNDKESKNYIHSEREITLSYIESGDE